ncbi:DapH/DapD/GlmU-related protein [Nosocomiicoccus sp. HMSC09A07]|uniref:acyltransferase n=1 Tax=Nosocomiicoccus sp. HMSC09A07 TaxID=1581145 RepID=UPI0008A48405|nr:DapH/DapD/GlmU-related protein [Nosocomiicoccus sp. HMSC09A07]OFS62174.1 hypothetical protein HMPREF3177_06665 [Nosocomiicoccus sp. HMSC09A07]
MRVINMVKYHLYPNIVNAFLYIFPNSKLTTRLRGKLFSLLFKKCGKNLQIASGVIINMHRNIEIGDNVYIAHNVWLNGTGGLKIEDNVVVSPNVIIATTKHSRVDNMVSNTKSTNSPIKIGKGVWIAGNSTVSMGVKIEDGCIVSANTLVNKDITQKNVLVGGVPGRIIKTLNDKD